MGYKLQIKYYELRIINTKILNFGGRLVQWFPKAYENWEIVKKF